MADTPEKSLDPAPQAAPEPAPGPGAGRLRRWALVVSLAVNLLVVGAVAGLWLSHGRDHDRFTRADRGGGFGMYVRALSPEDRAALREAYRAGRQEENADGAAQGAAAARDWRADRRADQADLLAALRAEPFQPAAVAAVFDRHIAAMSAGMARGRALMLARIEAMAAPERAAFADRLEQMMSRAGHKGWRDRDERR